MEHRSWKDFEAEWTNAMVDSVNFVREKAGLTIEMLAERLQQVGWPGSKATLAGILSGRKRSSLSVAELTVFARALDVSPSFLLLGLPLLAEMPKNSALWGRESLTPVSLAAWLRAYASPPPLGAEGETSVLAREALNMVMQYSNTRRAVAWQAALVIAAGQLRGPERQKLAERHVVDRSRLVPVARNLASYYSDLAQLGDFAPKLPAVPAPLDGLPRGDVEKAVNEMSDEELVQLTSDEHVADAKNYWYSELDRIDAATA